MASTEAPTDVNSPAPAPAEPVTPREDLDAPLFDESPPLAPAADTIQLLVQSPEKLFLYWGHARDPFEALRKSLGHVADDYRLTVLLVRTDDGSQTSHPAAPERHQWLDAAPGSTYRAEVGFSGDGLPFVRLLSSEEVTTPPRAVSHVIDDAPQLRPPPSETLFAALLAEAGISDAAPWDAARVVEATSPSSSTFFSSADILF